jgi:hypothetical protein
MHARLAVPLVDMRSVCARLSGVGRALAEDFLEAGDNVVICSRSGECLQGCRTRGWRASNEIHSWQLRHTTRHAPNTQPPLLSAAVSTLPSAVLRVLRSVCACLQSSRCPRWWRSCSSSTASGAPW